MQRNLGNMKGPQNVGVIKNRELFLTRIVIAAKPMEKGNVCENTSFCVSLAFRSFYY